VLDALLPAARGNADQLGISESDTRQIFRKRLREGALDDREVEIELDAMPIGVEIMAPPGMEEMTNQLQDMFANVSGGRKKSVRLKVKDRSEERRVGKEGRSRWSPYH